MAEPGRDRRFAHDYDGIEEYDNPLPGWWVWIFVGTILFSVGYYAYYQIGPGPSILALYEREEEAVAQRLAKQAPAASGPTDDALAALVKSPAAVTKGREIYASRCVPCHGARAEGVIGPNLTDEYWLHGGRPTEILRTITKGAIEKGMVPWEGQLKPDELEAVTAYVVSLAGSRPPNPKPPQGVTATGQEAPLAPTASR